MLPQIEAEVDAAIAERQRLPVAQQATDATLITLLRLRARFDMTARLRGLERQAGGDLDRSFQAAIDGALLRIESVNTGRGIVVALLCLQPQFHMDPPDDQDIIFQFDFADGLRREPAIRSVDLTRLQRASKGSGESTRGCRDNIIERSRMGLQYIRRDLVVLGDCAVYAENHRAPIRPADTPCEPALLPAQSERSERYTTADMLASDIETDSA